VPSTDTLHSFSDGGPALEESPPSSSNNPLPARNAGNPLPAPAAGAFHSFSDGGPPSSPLQPINDSTLQLTPESAYARLPASTRHLLETEFRAKLLGLRQLSPDRLK
jgi:hypothetical protein